MRIEFRKVGQRVAADAMVHLRSFLEVHAAQASAKGATLVDFQIGPFPHAKIFGDGVAVISNNLKGVGVLGDKPIATGALENGQDVGRLYGKPLAADVSHAKMLVEVPLKLKCVGRLDPPEQPQFHRVAGLQVTLARLDVLRDSDLDRGTSVFILANEINWHVALPAPLSETVEQQLDHLLARVRDDVERPVFLPHECNQEAGRERPEG